MSRESRLIKQTVNRVSPISKDFILPNTSNVDPLARIDGSALHNFSSGSVLFIDANRRFCEDNNAFFWDKVNNRLGLGTTTPAVDVHLKKTTPIIRIDMNNDVDNISRTMGGLELNIGRNQANDYQGAIKWTSTDVNFVTENPKFVAGIVAQTREHYSSDTDGGAALHFLTTPNNCGATNVPVIRMSIDNNGKVGVNKTQPTYDLEVDGQFRSTETSYLATDAGSKVGIGTTSVTKGLQLNFNSSSTDVTTGNGLAGGAAGNGLLIKNTNTNTNTYANLDFRSNNADGRIAYRYKGTTNVGDFHFITDNTGSPKTSFFIGNNGLIGIGTTTPTYNFDVLNPSGSAKIGLSRANTVIDSNYGLGHIYFGGEDTNDPFSNYDTASISAYAESQWSSVDDTPTRLVFKTTPDGSGTRVERMTIKGDGNVGIGTTSPTNALSFGSSSIISTATADNSDNDRLRITGGGTASSSRGAVIILEGNEYSSGNGDLILNPGANAAAQVQLDATMYVGDGNVGIGTDSPQKILHVNKNAGSVQLRLERSLTETGFYDIGSNDNGLNFWANGYNNKTGAEVTFNLDGNVGIGTTSPDEKLEVNGKVHVTNDLYFTGDGSGLPFAQISAESNATDTELTEDTWTQVTIFDTNGVYNDATPDYTNDHITIGKAGVYQVMCSITANSSGGTGALIEFAVKKNDGASIIIPHMDRTLAGGGGESGCLTISGLADLANGDTIELWVKNESNNDDIVIEDVSLHLVMIGGT